MKYFPLELGQRRLYATFYGSRKPFKKELVQKTYWEEVIAQESLHGFNVFIVRSSEGQLTGEMGSWVYGEPETILGETIYVLTSQGVHLQAYYQLPGASELEYFTKREQLLETIDEMSRTDFIKGLNNWVLPFPVRPGMRRRSSMMEGYYYKILRTKDKGFVPVQFKKRALGVAGFMAGNWGMTRWFVPNKGIVLHEWFNKDEGVDLQEYPFKFRSLLNIYSPTDE